MKALKHSQSTSKTSPDSQYQTTPKSKGAGFPSAQLQQTQAKIALAQQLQQGKSLQAKISQSARQQQADKKVKLINQAQVAKGGASTQRVTQQGAPVQRRGGTLSVDTGTLNQSVDEVPHDAAYKLGFDMDVSLDIDEKVPAGRTLQDEFPLTQYVRDSYTFWNEDDEIADQQDLSDWERDEYGADEDGGDWGSDRTDTWWNDTPGWTTNNNQVSAGYLLDSYTVEFYFTIGDGQGGTLFESEVITLNAEADDDDKVTYTTEDINENIDYDPDDSDDDGDLEGQEAHEEQSE